VDGCVAMADFGLTTVVSAINLTSPTFEVFVAGYDLSVVGICRGGRLP